MSRRRPAAELAALATRALRARGLSEQHTAWVVDGLVESSLRGIDTHGLRLLETYLAELDGGRSRAQPELRFSGERPAARALDAGAALGLVAGRAAAEEAARLARENGVGAVSVGNSNHFGAASVYTLALARKGLVGLSFSNSDALVAPENGRRPFFGTNPISLAAASEDELFCADFATSQVSYSRVKAWRAEGRELEPGWAICQGEELLALEPLGGHKGQCLGMMVEILCAVLAGMPFDHQISHLYDPPYDQPRRISHLILALDPEAFAGAATFRQNLGRLLAAVRQEPGEPGHKVIAPGDLEKESTAERLERGIPLTAKEWAFFERLE